MTEETVDHSVLGIIDESEPEQPEAADADYVRGDDAPSESDNPSDDLEGPEDTGDDVAAKEEDDAADAQSVEPEKDTQDDGEGGDEDVDEDGPIEFAGRKYESYEAAEQAMKSWDGRIRASEDKVKDYEQRLADYYEYVQNVGKENEELRSGKTAGTPPEGTETAPEAPTEVDMNRVLELARIAELNGAEPMEAAIKIYDMESKKIMDTRLSDMETKLSAPIEEMESNALTAQAERELFQWAQSEADEDGAPKYPMLQQENLDPDFIGNVYEAWNALGQKFGPEYAYSQVGIDYAYTLAHEYALNSGEYVDDSDDEVEGEPSGDSQYSELANADAEVASDLTGETPVLDRPKPTTGRAALQELGNLKEVAFDDGESLGFYQ